MLHMLRILTSPFKDKHDVSMQNKVRAVKMMQHCMALLTASSTSGGQNTTLRALSQPAVGYQAQQHLPSLALQPRPPGSPTAQLCDPCSSPSVHHSTATNAAQTHADIAGATAHSLPRAGSSHRLFECMPVAGGLQAQLRSKLSCGSSQKLQDLDLSGVVVELSGDTNEGDERSEPDLMPVPEAVQVLSNTTPFQCACSDPSQMMLSLTHFFTAKHGMSWAVRTGRK